MFNLERIYEHMVKGKPIDLTITPKKVPFKTLQRVYAEDVQVLFTRPGSDGAEGPFSVNDDTFTDEILPVLLKVDTDTDEEPDDVDVIVKTRLLSIAKDMNVTLRKRFVNSVFRVLFDKNNTHRIQFDINTIKIWKKLSDCIKAEIPITLRQKFQEEYNVSIDTVIDKITDYKYKFGFIQFKIAAGENRALNYGTGEFLLSRCIRNAKKGESGGDLEIGNKSVEVKGVTPSSAALPEAIKLPDMLIPGEYRNPTPRNLKVIMSVLRGYINAKVDQPIDSFIFINDKSNVINVDVPSNISRMTDKELFDFFKQHSIWIKARNDRGRVFVQFHYAAG